MSEAPVRTETEKPKHPPKRVLVADDEKHIVRLIQLHLERAGHTVTIAYDGQDALNAALDGNFDLIILDVMMPIMDGFEVLRMLRQDPKTENTPVIILTARTQDHDVFMGYHYGADMYLTKPFNPRELMTIVERF